MNVCGIIPHKVEIQSTVCRGTELNFAAQLPTRNRSTLMLPELATSVMTLCVPSTVRLVVRLTHDPVLLLAPVCPTRTGSVENRAFVPPPACKLFVVSLLTIWTCLTVAKLTAPP